MKCRKCDTDMVIRYGKFGAFHACPKSNPSDNHGTKALLVKRFVEILPDRCIDLDIEIQRQMMPYIGRMTDLDLFVEGGYEASLDDDSHWMNTRPY